MTNAKEVKYYKIGTKEYSVGELTLGQDERIADLLADVFGTDDFTDSKDKDILKTVVKGLAANKLLTKAFGIILTERDYSPNKEKVPQFFKEVGDLTNSKALEIVADFLPQNGDLMNSLLDIFTTLSPIKTKEQIIAEDGEQTKKDIASSARSILDGETKLK